MQNICNFQIFSKSPLLYPKFVQIFQIGPKHIIDFQGLASFWNNDLNIFLSKRFSIKFCIWKSNRFFSLHWASPLKMAQSQNREYESEKMTLKTGISFNRATTKIFSPSVSPKLGNSENVVLTWPLTSWSLFTGQFFTLKSPF